MSKKKILVLGATGIIGQHLMTNVPIGVDPAFTSRRGGPGITKLDLASDVEKGVNVKLFLDSLLPWAIINLAGENNPDIVEKDPERYEGINAGLPRGLSHWCHYNDSHLVHVSSQAVFRGDKPPYGPFLPLESAVETDPVQANLYGAQKYAADALVSSPGLDRWTIVRPTFVLGVRPFPGVGRENPAEAMLGGRQPRQVYDRLFSVSFAWEVADLLWEIAQGEPQRKVIQIGSGSYSRTGVFHELTGKLPQSIEHDSLPGIAPRPRNTTFVSPPGEIPLNGAKMDLVKKSYVDREGDTIGHRAYELAAFLRRPENEVAEELWKPFQYHHARVTESFRACNPKTDGELLNWYRATESYLWELTSYHCDPGFNYRGMCEGITNRLLQMPESPYVLCLGDGIGDMSLAFNKADISTVYHDLQGSHTAEFARFRFWARGVDREIGVMLSEDFRPSTATIVKFSAVVAADFLEHLPCVEEWVQFIWEVLEPGGLLFAQNAFGIGSGEQGSMPMHLSCNNKFEFEWDPLLASTGFVHLGPNWYQKPLETGKGLPG